MVIVFFILAIYSNPILLTSDEQSAGVLTLRLLGISDHIPPTISVSSFKQLAITPLLFLGPLYAQLLSRRLPLMQDWSYKEDVSGMFFNWVGFRNFFMVCLICKPNGQVFLSHVPTSSIRDRSQKK